MNGKLSAERSEGAAAQFSRPGAFLPSSPTPLTSLPAYLPVHRSEASTSSIRCSSTVSAPGTPPHP